MLRWYLWLFLVLFLLLNIEGNLNLVLILLEPWKIVMDFLTSPLIVLQLMQDGIHTFGWPFYH